MYNLYIYYIKIQKRCRRQDFISDVSCVYFIGVLMPYIRSQARNFHEGVFTTVRSLNQKAVEGEAAGRGGSQVTNLSMQQLG